MASNLSRLLARLPRKHQRALQWFEKRTGAVIPWPNAKPSGVLLASKAKAIYKPQWSPYALSIRQNLESPYSNIKSKPRVDRPWGYRYSLEGSPKGRVLFTNRALQRNQIDHVPVAVFEQVSSQPSRYKVHGLALVVSRNKTHFVLEGFSSKGANRGWSLLAQQEEDLDNATRKAEVEGAFDPSRSKDEREKIYRSIAYRRGRERFRKRLLEAYDWACAMTGCRDLAVLEAAHIHAYKGRWTDHVQNGLLLRADIHTLFDLGLMAVDPQRRVIRVSPALSMLDYTNLDGRPLRLPNASHDHPSRKALAAHWKAAKKKWPT